MSPAKGDAAIADFNRLITNLRLTAILPFRIHVDRLGGDPAGATEVMITWDLTYDEEDPLREANGIIRFMPQFLVTMKQGEYPLFQLESVIAVVFQVVDETAFDQAWANAEVKKIFLHKQIHKTLWPIIRQQALDGMTRLGFPGVPLPWITE